MIGMESILMVREESFECRLSFLNFSDGVGGAVGILGVLYLMTAIST